MTHLLACGQAVFLFCSDFLIVGRTDTSDTYFDSLEMYDVVFGALFELGSFLPHGAFSLADGFALNTFYANVVLFTSTFVSWFHLQPLSVGLD